MAQRLRPAVFRSSAALAAVMAVGLNGTAAAHGDVPTEPPSVGGLLLGWTVEPGILIPLIAIAAAWLWAVRRVNRAHRSNPVPRRRSAFFLAGLAAIAVALLSGIERYDTSLFSVHMVQHLLLAMIAAPLLALGAPITLALRIASPGTRRGILVPILHSRALSVVTHPVVAWLVFASVMWGTHFSSLFDAALEDRVLHDLEHLLFLGSGLLFWWPAVAADPTPRRLGHPVRILYVFLQMPQNTFLAVTLLNAGAPLYPHYATLDRGWGPDPLLDQQIAAGIMWLGGDLLFLAAVLALVASWMRAEERAAPASDRRTSVASRAILERSGRLAASRVTERPEDAEDVAATVSPLPGSDAAGSASPAAPDSDPDPRSHR